MALEGEVKGKGGGDVGIRDTRWGMGVESTDRRRVLCPSQLQGGSRKQGRDEQGKERAQARAQPGELGQRTTVYVRGKQAVTREQSPSEDRGRFDKKSHERAKASEEVGKDDETETEARSWAERVPAVGALRHRQEQM